MKVSPGPSTISSSMPPAAGAGVGSPGIGPADAGLIGSGVTGGADSGIGNLSSPVRSFASVFGVAHRAERGSPSSGGWPANRAAKDPRGGLHSEAQATGPTTPSASLQTLPPPSPAQSGGPAVPATLALAEPGGAPDQSGAAPAKQVTCAQASATAAPASTPVPLPPATSGLSQLNSKAQTRTDLALLPGSTAASNGSPSGAPPAGFEAIVVPARNGISDAGPTPVALPVSVPMMQTGVVGQPNDAGSPSAGPSPLQTSPVRSAPDAATRPALLALQAREQAQSAMPAAPGAQLLGPMKAMENPSGPKTGPMAASQLGSVARMPPLSRSPSTVERASNASPARDSSTEQNAAGLRGNSFSGDSAGVRLPIAKGNTPALYPQTADKGGVNVLSSSVTPPGDGAQDPAAAGSGDVPTVAGALAPLGLNGPWTMGGTSGARRDGTGGTDGSASGADPAPHAPATRENAALAELPVATLSRPLTASSPTSAPAPSASAAAQVAMEHLAASGTARALGNALRGDLHIGVQTEAFGRVTIQTSTGGGQMAAQLLLENTRQSASLAAHLPGLEQTLAHRFGLDASVRVATHEGAGWAGGGMSGGAQSSASDARSGQSDGRAADRPDLRSRAPAAASGTVPVESVSVPRYQVSSTAARLDITV